MDVFYQQAFRLREERALRQDHYYLRDNVQAPLLCASNYANLQNLFSAVN